MSFVYNGAYREIARRLFEENTLVDALKAHGLSRRDIDTAIVWFLCSKPGETMMLVRYKAPHIRIDHDGNVTEVAPSAFETRTERAVEWYDEHERMP